MKRYVAFGLAVLCAIVPACGRLESSDDIAAGCNQYREVYTRCFGGRDATRDSFREQFKVEGKSKEEVTHMSERCLEGAAQLESACPEGAQ
jgi:hypothetical protein